MKIIKSNLKKLFATLNNKKGFVMVEFVIALPLLILLIYTLVEMFLNVTDKDGKLSANSQANDYILESEANDILSRITRDARAAVKVTYSKGSTVNAEREDITFYFHTNPNSNIILTNDKSELKDIIDVIDTRNYIRYAKNSTDTRWRLYAQRQNKITSPISGNEGNKNDIPGDTSIEELKFSIRKEKILHISLKIKSIRTGRVLSVNTSVYMPACEEIQGF